MDRDGWANGWTKWLLQMVEPHRKTTIGDPIAEIAKKRKF